MGNDDDNTIIFNEPSTNMFEQVEDGETLFERYFVGENINADKRNYCYMILNNIREVVNSRLVDKNQSNVFELQLMYFRRIELDKYGFDGLISNGKENKYVHGVIKISEHEIKVDTNYYRTYEYLKDEERFYTTEDTFIEGANGYLRVTSYSDCVDRFVEPANILSYEDTADYAFEKSRTLVPRKDKEMSN